MLTSTSNSKNPTHRREAQPNPQEIVRALKLLHKPGEVFEVRALSGKLRRSLSGYFDDHAKATTAARDAVDRGAEGIYVTLNPVNPALLSRAKNRTIEAQRNAGTADKDIVRRRWLFIDLTRCGRRAFHRPTRTIKPHWIKRGRSQYGSAGVISLPPCWPTPATAHTCYTRLSFPPMTMD